MKVSLIKIQNIMGVSELKFEPGQVTEITGGNAQGKTSILEAIRSVTQGAADARLLRKGEKTGEVVLVLDDGTELGRQFKPGSSAPFVRKGDLKASKPGSYISRMANAFAANPVRFLNGTPKQQVEILLEAMPVEVDEKRVQEITGIKPHKDGAQGLALLDELTDLIYGERRTLNRQVKERQAAIDRLQDSLPDDAQDISELKAEREAVTDEIDEATQAANKEIEKNRDKRNKENEKAEAKMKELQEQIENLQSEIVQRDKYTVNRAGEIRNEQEKAIGEKRARLAALNEKIDAAGREANTLEFIQSETKRADELKQDSQIATARLEALDKYRAELLGSIPVKGLTIDDGEIHLGGIPFARCSTSQQVTAALEIAKLNAGELGLVCVDGLEVMEPKNYAALIKAAEKADVQLICTRVGEGELEVKAH